MNKFRSAGIIFIFGLIYFYGVNLKAQSSTTLVVDVNKAVQMALRNNEQILIAANEVDAANARIREAWADAMPKIMFNSLYTRNIKQPVFFFPDPRTGQQRAFRIGSRNAYVFTLTVEQTLYQAGKVAKGIRAAKLFKKFNSEGFRAVKSEVIFSVKKAFYTVLLNQQLLEINRQSLEQQYQHLVNTRKLFQQGQVSELDTLRAWVDYTNLQPQVIRAENNLRISKNELKKLMGLKLHQPIQLQGTLDFEPTDGLALEQILNEAMNQRPELKQLEFQASMLKENVGITRADLLPKLFFSGTYQNIAQSDRFDFGDQGLQSTISGSVRLEIPIFNGMRTYAKIQQAQIDYQNTLYQIEQFRDNLKIEIDSILSRLKEAEKRVMAQQQAIKQAERALFMAERRYNEGVGTQLELGDAILALNVTKTNYVQAVYDHEIAMAELEKAIGRE